MMPTNVAARMTLDADPGSLQGAVAAGILGCGPVILGTSEECARLLDSAQEEVVAGGDPARVAEEAARAIHASGGKAPGFGHPVHRPLDPRAERILELADERGVSGPHVLLARELRDAVAHAWGRPLTMNVSMAIAAVLLDLGFPPATAKADSVARSHRRPARAPGRGAGEPGRLPDGRQGRGRDRLRAPARGRARLMLEREVEARPWGEQLAIDDECYRAQLGYLFERSTFYREKLAAAGFTSAAGGGRSRSHRGAPTHREGRAPRDAERATTRSVRISAPHEPRSSGSTRRAGRPARRATSR